ncbi:hypothetical protein GALL_135480 [mine drainage metagenome]|uniref:TonB C-terminal domain-containing protein n=1 Tax=mine drainage metagenome TaxID=410659 RepID=A0A1J5SRU0_9ZZZZ
MRRKLTPLIVKSAPAMPRLDRPRAGLLVAGLLSLFSVAASANTDLVYAKRHGSWEPVIRVLGDIPYVLDGDRLAPANPGEFAMRPITQYHKGMPPPVIINVDNVDVGSQGIQFVGDSQVINNQFDISIKITSPIDLANVYVVFVISGERGRKSILVREVGDLKAGEPDFFEYHVPIASEMGPFRYRVRFFSNGLELFFPSEGWGYINAEVAQRIRVETEGVDRENPRPYVIAHPEIPESVIKSGKKKTVLVHATILASGVVPDAHAAAGTPADVADAAVKAIENSYFLPKIVDGFAQNCNVSIPVVFDPRQAPRPKSVGASSH